MGYFRAVVAALFAVLALFAPAQAKLVDQRGAPFALDGGPIVVTFIATRCTDACPIANAILSSALAKTASGGVRASFVTATLDPDYDTPFVMAAYAGRLDADPARWRFVSGSRTDVRALMRRFGVTARAGADGIPETHSSFIYVVDRGRTVRTFLLSSDAGVRIAQFLKREFPSSKISQKA